jgi:hypothetical protein
MRDGETWSFWCAAVLPPPWIPEACLGPGHLPDQPERLLFRAFHKSLHKTFHKSLHKTFHKSHFCR